MIRYTVPILLALNLFAASTNADVLAEAAIRTQSSGGFSFSPLMPECLQGGFGIPSVDVSCTEAGNSGRGRAQAAYGSLRAYAELSALSSIAFNQDYQAFGRARFDDTLTLSSPLLEPGIGTFVNVFFDLTGSIQKMGRNSMNRGTCSLPPY